MFIVRMGAKDVNVDSWKTFFLETMAQTQKWHTRKTQDKPL